MLRSLPHGCPVMPSCLEGGLRRAGINRCVGSLVPAGVSFVDGSWVRFDPGGSLSVCCLYRALMWIALVAWSCHSAGFVSAASGGRAADEAWSGRRDPHDPTAREPTSRDPIDNSIDNPIDRLRVEKGYVWHSLEASYRGVGILVHYLSGDERWAGATLERVLKALPALEAISGSRLPVSYPIHIWEVRDSDLGLAGQNIREAGILISRDQDVIVHELAHYWVGSHNVAEHWMAEGLAELYAHLVDRALSHRAWKPPDLSNLKAISEFDGPLALWRRVDQIDATLREREINRFYYDKAFLFWYGLERVNGPGFIRALQRWIDRGPSLRDSGSLTLFLERHRAPSAPGIWELYPGWLTHGDYTCHDRVQSLEWYVDDSDQDGVINYEEFLLGLDPERRDSDGDGLADGWELYEGRDPRRAEPAPQGPAEWVVPQWTPSSSHRFVRAGETLHIHARGLWRMAEPKGLWYGADGIRIGREEPPWGELLAQVGWGPDAGFVHRIGVSGSFVADRTGILYFFARGMHKRMGRGGLLVSVRGGRRLPELNAHGSRLLHPEAVSRMLRERGIQQLELDGRHVTLVLNPEDLESMRDPNATLDYLDRVYEHYVKLSGEVPYKGRRITLAFDVTSRDRIHYHGNAMMLFYGLDHLNALFRTRSAEPRSWGLTYGLAMPFLEWLRADRILESRTLWAFAELMAADFFEAEQVSNPAIEAARRRLASYLQEDRSLEELREDKRLAWTFLNSLRRDYGWEPFRRVLRAYARHERLPPSEPEGRIPLEDFLIAFARAAHVNLTHRYEAWGIPVTARMRALIGSLPSPQTRP